MRMLVLRHRIDEGCGLRGVMGRPNQATAVWRTTGHTTPQGRVSRRHGSPKAILRGRAERVRRNGRAR